MATPLTEVASVRSETRLQQFRRHIGERYFVRLHMTLILMATGLSGVVASRALLSLGITSVKVRFPINVVVAYVVFLLLVRIWIIYVRSSYSAPNLTPDGESIGDVIADGGESLLDGDVNVTSLASSADTASVAAANSPGGGSGSWFDFDPGDSGIILVVLGVLIAVIFGAGFYLIWMAPEILGEIAFNAILASSLVRVTNRLGREGWIEGAVRATIVPFSVVFITTVALAYVVHRTCPPAATVRQALSCPVLPQSK